MKISNHNKVKTFKTYKAKKVREGDFLVGLDNGYVTQVNRWSDPYSVAINFHDRHGNECSLSVGPDFRLDVMRTEEVKDAKTTSKKQRRARQDSTNSEGQRLAEAQAALEGSTEG